MHHQQPGVLPHPLNFQSLSLPPAAAYLLRHSPPQPSSFFAGLQPVPPASGMVAADKRAIFSTIAKMARQICAVSEEAETTGVLSGLNYMLLQSLGGAIDQQVKLIDAPSTSTPSATLSVATASTGSSVPPASPPRAVDVCKTSGKRKSKHGASEPSHATPSTTSSTSKRRRKEEAPATADSSSHTTATSDEVKKCLDCGRTKTNQWRSGPEGMSTLCNACGMRYTRRMKRQVTPAHTANPNNNNNNHNNSDSAVIGRSVLDSPLCGHESDHGGLSPVSSPLPFNHSSPMLDEPTTPAGSHHQQEKRSNLYTLLN